MLLGKPDALFALSIGWYQGPIGVDASLTLSELSPLPLPDDLPSIVDDIHQGLDLISGESSAKTTCCCRIRNCHSAQGIEECFVVPPQLDIVERMSTTHRVASERGLTHDWIYVA